MLSEPITRKPPGSKVHEANVQQKFNPIHMKILTEGTYSIFLKKGELFDEDVSHVQFRRSGKSKDDLVVGRRRFVITTNPQVLQRVLENHAIKTKGCLINSSKSN